MGFFVLGGYGVGGSSPSRRTKILDSSEVEQSAVNREVVCSIHTPGAIFLREHSLVVERRPVEAVAGVRFSVIPPFSRHFGIRDSFVPYLVPYHAILSL